MVDLALSERPVKIVPLVISVLISVNRAFMLVIQSLVFPEPRPLRRVNSFCKSALHCGLTLVLAACVVAAPEVPVGTGRPDVFSKAAVVALTGTPLLVSTAAVALFVPAAGVVVTEAAAVVAPGVGA